MEDGSAQDSSLSIDVGGTTISAAVIGARNTDIEPAEQVQVRLRVSLDFATTPGASYRSEGRATLPTRPRLILRPRTPSDDLGISLGLNRPFPSGDEAFDSSVWVASTHQAGVSDLLAIPDVRSATVALLRLGAESLRMNDGDTNLTIDVWLRTRDPDARNKLREALPVVASLSRALPRFTGDPPRASILSAIMEHAFLPLPLLGIVSSLGSYEWRAPLDTTPVLVLIGFGLALGVVSTPLAFLAARGRHNGFLLFKSTAIPLLVGLPGLAVTVGILLNGAWDEQHAKHRAEVLEKRSGDDDELRVRDYRPGAAGALSFEVERELWDVVEPGDQVVLTVSEGRLGWPWLADVQAE